jgi:hypothetical protein
MAVPFSLFPDFPLSRFPLCLTAFSVSAFQFHGLNQKALPQSVHVTKVVCACLSDDSWERFGGQLRLFGDPAGARAD